MPKINNNNDNIYLGLEYLEEGISKISKEEMEITFTKQYKIEL